MKLPREPSDGVKKMKKFFKNLSRFVQRNLVEIFAFGMVTDNLFSPSLSRVEVILLLLMLNLSRKIDMPKEK